MSVVYVNTHMNIHIILQNTPRVYHQVLQQTDIIIIYNITTGYIPGTCQYTHNDLSEYSRLFIIVCNTCCIHYIYISCVCNVNRALLHMSCVKCDKLSYTVQCRTLLHALYAVHLYYGCTLYNPSKNTVLMYTIHCTLQTIHCTVHTVQCITYTAQYIVYSVRRIVYTSAMYVVNCRNSAKPTV